MRISPELFIRVSPVANARANEVLGRLHKHAGRISFSAGEIILRRLTEIPAGSPDHLDNKRMSTIIEGLSSIESKQRPSAEAIQAAEDLGLMFAVSKDGVVLALKREVEELEGLNKGFRVIDFETIRARHREVAAFHGAIEAIDALMRVDPNLLGENVNWATRDPKTGKFSAKTAFAERASETPTAILPPANFTFSMTLVGTENAKGIFWGGRMLSRTTPFDLTSIGEFGFKVKTSSGFLNAGDTTVNEVLQRLGFSGPAKRPILEIFACLPAPMPNAEEAERFVPRGFMQIDSLEGGMYAIITILQDKAQKHVLTMEGNSSTVIMGEEAKIGGQDQLTYLTFESVPAMNRAREKETRSAQRGNIVVLAVPVKPYFDFPVITYRGSDDYLGGSTDRGSFGGFSKGLGVTLGGEATRSAVSIGSTNIGRDEKSASGVTLKSSGRVVMDHSRQPQIIRIVPIGISVENTAEELGATVIDFTTRRKIG